MVRMTMLTVLTVLISVVCSEAREWIDTSRNQTIEADFVACKVTLRLPNGRKKIVDMKSLSEADRDFVIEALRQQAANPAKAIQGGKPVVAGNVPKIKQAEVTRFATDKGVKAPRSTFYVDPYIQGHRFSGTSDGHSFVDVTLDAKAQTILYNEVTFKTVAPTVLSTTYDDPLPGTFKTSQIQATITVNPFSITAKNVGPLLLHRRDSIIDIERAGIGTRGGFAAIPLTGTYSVSRGKDTAAGKFKISLPIWRYRQFPEQYLDIHDHPISIMLKGRDGNDDRATWMDWPSGNNPNRTEIYRGKVGGIETVLELKSVDFRLDGEITLSPVPLAGPGKKGNAP